MKTWLKILLLVVALPIEYLLALVVIDPKWERVGATWVLMAPMPFWYILLRRRKAKSPRP